MPKDEVVRPIRLPEQIVSDLTDLVKNRDHIANIVGAAESVSPASSIRAFTSRVAENVDVEPSVVFDVLHTLVNIRRMQRAKSVEAERMIEILTVSLQRDASERWKEEYFQEWRDSCEAIVGAIEKIHEDHPLFVSEKAESLAYSHQNILTSQRIITDIRPVFDTAGAEIKETLILHTLLIEYYDGISAPKRIAFTLDLADIAELRKACQRAEGKAKSALHALDSLNPIELPEKLED
jgi:hypothetical protein